jgi:DNA repair protein RadC
MKQVAPHDRPREKLARAGPTALGDNELLALVIGHGTRRSGALDLANELLADVGGVRGLARATLPQVVALPGLGIVRAARVLAALELGRRSLARAPDARLQFLSPRDVAAFLLPEFGLRPVEHFGAVLLDQRNRLLRTTVLSVGTLDASVAQPREVFREAAVSAAAAVVIFHNHPSGDPSPSPDDVAVTRRMVAAGAVMGIDVLDHLILADARYFSFKESNRL